MSDPTEPAPQRETVQVRRAPKIPAFMAVGGLVGFLVVLIVTPLFPADPLVGLPALVGYFSLYGVTIGVVVGALIGIVLDRRSRRQARTVAAERHVVDAAPVEGELED
ncbi:hypothetical protein [Microcella sp.]|uniref:hypothetical protein n=1 Tax=Microcella sp. TaxID=1913979 RepID=UPI00391B8C4E